MSYEIPANLPAEIDELEALVRAHLDGKVDGATLKARRVPFGCYEQRKDGTYMVRIRTAGGVLTPRQLRGIATVAQRHGADFIHITTRQEFQIHDVALEDVTRVMRELLAFGLATRGGGGNTVRNIMVSPDAGVGLDEVFDPTPYALALTSRLIAEPDSWLLPRKFKIAFSNSAADTAYAQFNDVGFVATVQEGVKGFKVYVAGGMGTKPEVAHLLHDFIPAEDVYAVTTAVKRLFDQHGNRKNKHAARLRFLWNSLGESRFRGLYAEELGRVREQNPAPLAIHELPQANASVGLAPLQNHSTEFSRWKQRFVSEQRQEGLYSVLLPAFVGNLKNTDALALADFLEGFGNHDVVRATFGQNLRLRNIPGAYLGNVYAVVRAFDELTSAPRLLANSIACAGADTCKLGICLSKGALKAIARKLTESPLDLDQIDEFKLNLSGCPNTCGQHTLADLGFYGNVGRKDQQMFPAYAVVAGAVMADGQARLAQNTGRISARDLPEFVHDVLKTWLERKALYASFAQYVDGEGARDIRAIADRYRQVPEFEDDKNYYFDWGSSEVFSLVGKGAGECSAGLFDLIEVDLKNARRLLEQSPRDDDALYQITLCSARALLITRGIEVSPDPAVFDSFRKHFIEAGLVSELFLPAIAAARGNDRAALRRLEVEMLGLVEAVEKLYQSMDDSLRFPAELTKAHSQSNPAARIAHLERDYRTVACPMNFVKVKLDLARLQQGELLKVLLGDGAPIQNVPRSVAQEGHKVLEQVRLGDHWAVLIQKEESR
jgi:sulfite reductase (ferredoxin)